MIARRLVVGLLLTLSACASARSSLLDGAGPDGAGRAREIAQLRADATEPDQLAALARLEESVGDDVAAFGHWLSVAERSPPLRRWAEVHLIDLIERIPLEATWLARVRRVPELAELAEPLALALGDEAALDQARDRLGTRHRWRRSSRLLRYPGQTLSAALDASRFGAELTSAAGFIASPEEGPGLYAFQLELPPGDHHVEVLSECAVRALAVGAGERTLVNHEALQALLAERVAFDVALAPGEALQLHLVSRAAVARARVFIRPLTPPRPASELPLPAFEVALAESDFAAAAAALPRLAADTPFQRLAAARLAVLDPTRPPERARTAAKALLRAALDRDPGFVEARALLLRLFAEDQELDEALRILGSEPPHPALERAAVLALGLVDPARAAVLAEASAQRLPRSCRARADWLDHAAERLRFHPEALMAAFTEPLVPVPGPCLEVRLRAIDLLRDSSHLTGAEALLRPLLAGLDPGPERARAETLAAQLALAAGEWQAAAAAAGRALESGGADAFAHELLARARRLEGGPPAPRLDPLADLGLPLSPARPLILAHRAAARTGDGHEVLLDDRHVRVYPDGALKIRVHRIVRVNDVAAVEAVGELPLPDDAEVLLVRTWKHDHGGLRSLEPEDILEKATVSLPNLAPGDYAEWAWFYPQAAEPRLTPGWRAPVHAFDSDAGPVSEARYTLSLAPGARPPVFQLDPRMRPPQRPDASTWIFSARALPRVFGETLDPRPELRRLMLAASSGSDRLAQAAAQAAEIAFATRSSPLIAAWVEDVRRQLGERSPEALLQALYDRVRADIDEPAEASPFGVEASWVAERRRGSRALLLTALCRHAGLACELVLARPLWEGPEPSQPDDGLTYPLVRWAPPGQAPRWLDPASRWMPLGLLPPALEGVFAVSLGAPARPPDLARRVSPALLITPKPHGADGDPSHWGERKVAIELALEPGGAGFSASGRETLDGVFAASWRGGLMALSAEARHKLLSAIVQQALPGASVDEVLLEHLEDEAEPLTWSWRARGTTEAASGVLERGARIMAVALFPESLTHDTVVLPQRTTPLLVNRAARMSLSLKLVAPPGWAFVNAPSDQDLTFDLGHFQRTSRFAELGREVIVDKRFLLRPGVVDPARYAAWSDAAAAIDRFDLVQVVVAPTTRVPP